MLLVHFLVAFAIFFPITIFVITLYRAYQEDGNPFNLNMFLLLLIVIAVTCTSCTKEDFYPPLCIDGCKAYLNVELPQDGNGFYLVNSSTSRFNVHIEASPTTSFYEYNDTSVIEVQFYGDMITSGKNYMGRKGGNYYTKKIIGPITDNMVGDTITVSGDVYWDGGREYKIQEFSFKFIVE